MKSFVQGLTVEEKNHILLSGQSFSLSLISLELEFWSRDICLSRICFRNIGGHCEKAKQSHIRGDLCGRLPLRYCYCQCSCAAFSFLGSGKQAGGTLVFFLRQRLENLCFSRHFCAEHPGPGLHNSPRELLANMKSLVLYTLFSPKSSVYHREPNPWSFVPLVKQTYIGNCAEVQVETTIKLIIKRFTPLNKKAGSTTQASALRQNLDAILRWQLLLLGVRAQR